MGRLPNLPAMSLGALALTLVGFASCGLPGTGGEIVEVEWRFRSMVPEGATAHVTTVGEHPWEVELTEAKLIVGPVYAFAPPVARGGLAQFFGPLVGPSVARAHAGDDNTDGVRVVSELLDQVAVDLLDARPRMLQPAIAEAGPIDAMNILLDEARFELADEDGPTRGGHAWVRGVARRTLDGVPQEVRFAAALRDTIPDDRIARRVESLPIEGVLSQGATIEIGADPRPWVRQVRFDDLVDHPDAADEILVQEPSQFHNAWYLGLRDPASWTARVVPADLDP